MLIDASARTHRNHQRTYGRGHPEVEDEEPQEEGSTAEEYVFAVVLVMLPGIILASSLSHDYTVASAQQKRIVLCIYSKKS